MFKVNIYIGPKTEQICDIHFLYTFDRELTSTDKRKNPNMKTVD